MKNGQKKHKKYNKSKMTTHTKNVQDDTVNRDATIALIKKTFQIH